MRKLLIVLSSLLVGVISARAQTPYYQGKTIRIVTGYPAGDVNDLWPRLITQHMGKYIPGNPIFIVQNMPGASSMIAANYVYSVAKPDGLTLGWIAPTLYFDQLVGRKEVQYDWGKYSFIGSPSPSDHLLYMRADSPYQNIEDIRRSAEPPKCGSGGATGTGFYLPKLLDEALGTKFNIILGYQGGGPIDLAVEKGEIHCRAMTVESFFAREPFHTWRKNNFVKILVQTAKKRDPRMADTPTIYELMDQYKTGEQGRRIATVILAGGAFGRPLIGPAGIAPDRLKILQSAFLGALKDAVLRAEAEKRGYEWDPVGGQDLAKLAKEVMSQPAPVIDRMNKILGQ
jgi:tripartite-type tricarboxylate transporter receptor subunit TctC